MTKQVGDSQLIDTWAATGTIVDPDVTKKDEGWQLGEQPPHEWMNWLQNTFGQKLNHMLKNGVPDWNADTEYTDGVVRHDGSVWLAVETNTNSEPSAINANWLRIATADDVVDNAVLLTGDQTISGVKTFETKPSVNGDDVATEFDAGVGRTWQDVTDSRISGVTYTNTTGRDIMVSVNRSNTSGALAATGYINGIALIRNFNIGSGNPSSAWFDLLIPDGDTYRVDTLGTRTWLELR